MNHSKESSCFLTRHRGLLRTSPAVGITLLLGAAGLPAAWGQNPNPQPAPRDAVVDAQQPSPAAVERPEQQKNEHDRSDVFDPPNARPSSPVFQTQPKEG